MELFSDTNTYILWVGLVLLIFGSIYLIVEGFRVHRLFAGSIIGKLVKTLVVVVLIELYSLGVVSFAFVNFFPRGVAVLLPIVGLWILCLVYAIFSIHATRKQVSGLAASKN